MADNQTQSTKETQTVTVDELSKKIQETTNVLNQLKNGLNNLSLEQQSDKLSDIGDAILGCSDDLSSLEKDGSASISKKQLDTLKSQVNTLILTKDALQKQIEDQTKKEMDNLKGNIAQTQNAGTENGENKDGEEKSKKWRKTGLRIGGIGLAGWGIWRLGKRIFGGGKDKKESSTSTTETGKTRKQLRKERREQRRKERAERRANRPWRQKFLIGSAIGVGATYAGIKVYKNWNTIKAWVKEKLGLGLSFEESLVKVESDVKNGIMKDTKLGSFAGHFEDGIKYNESTQEICSYGEAVKIDKKNRKIVGLDVSFPNREQLIHAANIINFSRYMLAGSGATDTPFQVKNGDIYFNAKGEDKTKFIDASGNTLWGWILGGTGAVAGGILGRYAGAIPGAAIGTVAGGCAGAAAGATIDNKSTMNDVCSTLKKGANLDRFVQLLNDQKNDKGNSLWERVAMPEKEPEDKSPLQKYINNTMDAISLSYNERAGLNGIQAEMVDGDPSRYKITSYNQTGELKLEGCTAKKGEEISLSEITRIRIGKYDGDFCKEGEEPYLDLDFPITQAGLQEAIRVVNLTNNIRQTYKAGCAEEFPFSYGDVLHGGDRWKNTLTVDLPGAGGKTLIKNEEDYPTLTKDLKKSRNGTVANKWLGLGIQYIRPASDKYKEKKYDIATGKRENSGSKYINYLHQMGGATWKFDYWKKPGS